MIDTIENIKETEKEWEERVKKNNITEEDITSEKYDYIDKDR